MCQAEQGPLPFHFLFSAEQELSKSTCLFDLPEHRLHNTLAGRIDGFAHLGLKLLLHPIHPRRAFRQGSALRGQAMLAMFLLTCPEEALNLSFRWIGRFQWLHILFRTLAVAL